MNAKRKMKCMVGFILMVFLSIFGMGNDALGKTINLQDIDAPTGDYRWRDAADRLYSESYRTSYNYTQANVVVTYDSAPPTLRGTLTATKLKPNFVYQLKLAGFPGTAANERIGLAGRWWQEEWNGSAWMNGQNLNSKGNGSSPNPNDIIYFQNRDIVNATSPTGRKYRYTGYLVFDYFITDENGNAVLNFETKSSYHVLWKTSQQSATPSDGPVKSGSFDPNPSLSPAYDTDYPPQAVSVFGEWERLPVGGVYLQLADYTAQIILTEESFHGSGGSPYAGNWAAAMGAQIDFSLIQAPLVIEAENASIKTAGGIINGGWNLWSNGMVSEDVYIPAAGTYEVVVRAYGKPLGGIWPLMALSVDGVAGTPVTVGSSAYIDYSFQVALTPGVHSIDVAFLNDAYSPGGEDRNLYLDKFAIYSPPGIAKPELAGGLVIEAENASIKTTGGAIAGGWNLWSNGIVGEDVRIPAAGTYEVVVRAYGKPLGGVWPLMALSVDGVAGTPVTVGSSAYIDYSFQVALTPGVHSIDVAFLNDAYNPGVEDRNLYLDKFAIYSPPGIAKPELASK
jgi:hypothetical protein